MQMKIISTDRLTRRFGALTAVDEFTISVEDGEIFGLLGPNGAGKTTVIKMLTTLLPPTAGSAQIAGLDILKRSADVRRSIGYVPQMLSADGQLTGYENLLVFAKVYALPRRDREQIVHDALEFMGLTDVADRMVRTYSGGMIRRLEVAQSLLNRPRVLFLDEPTIGLDPLARRRVWEHLERLRAELGTSIFLTTHYMEEADSLCDRVAIMHLGKVAVIGSPTELKASLGRDGVTLEQVFAHHAGTSLEAEGSYREISRTRRTARRVG
jgi:ABC-2 type transport system ATP-binding protein